MSLPTTGLTTQTAQVAIKAAPEVVWQALTDGAITPAHHIGDPRPTTCAGCARAGSQAVERPRSAYQTGRGCRWVLMSTIEYRRATRFPSSVVLDSHSPADGILATDADLDGPRGPSIVYVNQSFTDISGYDADELIGHSPRVLQGVDTDRALMRRLSQDLRAGRPFTGQTTNYRKDGTPFTME